MLSQSFFRNVSDVFLFEFLKRDTYLGLGFWVRV